MFDIETIVTQRNNINWTRISLFAILFISIIAVDIYSIKLQEKFQLQASSYGNYRKIISKFNAIKDWDKQLTNTKAYLIKDNLRKDLAKLWITDRPILFFGIIQSNEDFDGDNYIIMVQYYNKYYKLPPIALKLICNKKMFNLFFRKYPHKLKSKTMSVIAKIEDIKIQSNPYSIESQSEMPIGYGNCLQILPVYIHAEEDNDFNIETNYY